MTGTAFRNLFVGAILLSVASATVQTFVPASSVRKASATGLTHTNYVVFRGARSWSHARGVARAAVDGYYPSDIRAAYHLPATGGTQAIAIIDAYDLPTNLHDFNVFSSQFGLPQETSSSATSAGNKVLQVIYASGTKPKANGDYGGEIALDIQWAHAVAPNAKIYLIECASNSISDLTVGIRKAVSLTDVREVSMSFGATEYSGETSIDSEFDVANRVFFAAAGDTSNELDYPAASPNVIGVGGTTLSVVGGTFVSESAWDQGGGGPSRYESLPFYQIGFTTGQRGTPDVAAVGDPQTGVAVYDSTPLSDGTTGWFVFGGTSLSCPICAAITNLRGIDAASSTAELQRQYSLVGTSHFRDIVTGSSGAYDATPGYDFITGLGTLTYTFPTTTYVPSSLSLTTGTSVGGVPGNVIVKDNHDYTLRSVSGAVVLQGTFATGLNAGASRTGATLSLTGMSSGTSLTVSLYNVATGAWDAVSTANFGTANGTLTLSIANPTNYFDANGTATFRVAAGGSGAFRLGLDNVQLSVSTTF